LLAIAIARAASGANLFVRMIVFCKEVFVSPLKGTQLDYIEEVRGYNYNHQNNNFDYFLFV
jgi:hypothetical protein